MYSYSGLESEVKSVKLFVQVGSNQTSSVIIIDRHENILEITREQAKYLLQLLTQELIKGE